MTSPAYSVRVHILPGAADAPACVLDGFPGMAVLVGEDTDPATGVRRVTIDTDGPVTLYRLRALLCDRLGGHLIHLADPVLDAAATGKTTQRLCVPTTTERDLALLDTAADRRVVEHLILNPGDLDACTARGRRIALVSNASAVHDLGPLPAGCVLPALESAAVHLRRATGLDIHPLPLAADTPQALAAACTALAPGFAALCLAHLHPSYTAAVRAALDRTSTPVVDTTGHAHAVATAAAVLNALRHKEVPAARARVILTGAHRGGDLSGLLTAAGIGSLTLYEPGALRLKDLAGPADLVVDLLGLPAPEDGTPVLRACPQDLPPLHATTHRPHPLHALPALLTAAVRTGHLDGRRMLAAVRALAGLAAPGGLLPPVDQPGLSQALTVALASAMPTDV